MRFVPAPGRLRTAEEDLRRRRTTPSVRLAVAPGGDVPTATALVVDVYDVALDGGCAVRHCMRGANREAAGEQGSRERNYLH
jgi:hypothetical protein